ncbi:sensor histidine kinase [Candidatus Pelagibacter sp. HIMB1321]|uniref:sensor histidine kinase n=1 Tax=Candidatus Pelagibacter sp. HIMB1321 TaxID=1388755 RepID=UPI000A080B0C|nr:HAMP domain-containing sensor histidine kinase [Candidatus Pelagibacter sp. HIMB1321]SMF81698.1 two-component system, OmpR family, sensor histidine kinase ChvG [Candidatus Pelagibacter sp. HIMB1321]
MFNYLLKNLSILKKFLFINLIFFSILGLFTFLYLKIVQPNLIKNKSSNHIKIINNTIDNLERLEIQFNEEDIRKFLFSTRFIFQSLDRVIFFDNQLDLVGDTDTLDLDPRSFSSRLDIVELEVLNEEKSKEITEKKNINIGNDNLVSLQDILFNYAGSKNFGIPFTFTQEEFNNFKLTTIKNVFRNDVNIGYVAITENANDIRAAIDERKTFVIRTAFAVGIVILIFSFVLNRYFLKPIQNLVAYTNKIKNKEHKKINIDNLKVRNDELGLLSKSLDDMTLELQKRISHAENFSTDLVHEIRNPLASLKSASEILSETKETDERLKLINILSHDVQRIERLITDYSQILKDEVALSKEKFRKIDLIPIIKSVVDDYNNIYQSKRGITISFSNDGNKNYQINGIENRIEQIIANLLDNAISFSEDNKTIDIKISQNSKKQIIINIFDEGPGFKEKDTSKIFKRFYSNRPDKFGQHSGLGLNIVKNLTDLHNASINALNRTDKRGANLEIIFSRA